MDLWGKKVGPYLQILHMNYGIGALLAPIMVGPFLLPHTDEKDKNHQVYVPDDVQVQWAFLMAGSISIVTGFVFLYFYLNDRRQAERKRSYSVDSSEESEFSQVRIYVAVFFVAIITHVGFAMETIIGKSKVA